MQIDREEGAAKQPIPRAYKKSRKRRSNIERHNDERMVVKNPKDRNMTKPAW
jgi:hypothetical protein